MCSDISALVWVMQQGSPDEAAREKCGTKNSQLDNDDKGPDGQGHHLGSGKAEVVGKRTE